jgi:hypothetical protein
MYKFYTLAIVILSVASSIGQSVYTNSKQSKLTADYQEPFRQASIVNNPSSRATIEDEYINFSYALTLATDSIPLNGWVYLFPDTMPRIEYAGTDYSFYRFTDRYHSAGDVLDLSSSIFNTITENAFDSTKSYRVDSALIEYYYARNIDNANDTIRIYISVEDGETLKEGSDAEPYPILTYDQATKAPAEYVRTMDVILGVDDTAWYDSKFLELALDIELEANQLMSVVIDYLPGYDYSDTSSYFNDLNPFILSCTKERQSKQTHMVSLGMDEVLTFNQGIFSDFYQVYGLNFGDFSFWNTQYANVYANEYWTKFDGENINTRYNHLDIWYLVSTTDEGDVIVEEEEEEDDVIEEEEEEEEEDNTSVGIEDIVDIDILVYPNPVKDQLTITLSNTNVKIEMYDIIGNLIYVNNAPMNKNIVQTSQLPKGLYTIKVGSLNRKVIVE